MQPTSLEAYAEVKRSLNSKQRIVLNVLDNLTYNGGSQTNTEIAQHIGVPINTITTRVLELREKGLVTEHVKRFCRITGHKAIAWRVRRPEEIAERQMEMAL